MRLSKLQFVYGQAELREIYAKIEGISEILYLTKLNFFFHVKSLSYDFLNIINNKGNKV